ncbi:MAG: tRNA (guanosine(46)-N7)-methyltransferase TrmB [Phycisphaerae bacterium]|nr:tRNA (guanosine(46)-N7)-methyltransferase TrmB [Phycisphaerae bacterium]
MRPLSSSHLHRRPGRTWDTAGILLEGLPVSAPLDPPAIFGNTRPVELEIGSGKGTFLLARAAARPELNFLGLEWAKAYGAYAADRVRRAGLTNVRLLCADAADCVHRRLPERSLWRIHIYFPDPWPKRRHHRRRLLQPAFLAAARRCLAIGGQLIVVTDHLDYYRQIQVLLANAEGLAVVPLLQMSDKGELVGSNFERKYIAQGRPFYAEARMRYR